jgi:hypothetical protein
MIVVYAGLVCWIATTIIVESELFRPLRDTVVKRRWEHPDDRSVWQGIDYLLRCHMCTGVWVGIAEALYLGPIYGRGVLGIVWTGLLIKAVAHLILELRPQSWPDR